LESQEKTRRKPQVVYLAITPSTNNIGTSST
jgi:hypothetical protein